LANIRRRRIEIVAVQRKQVICRPIGVRCPLCGLSSELLTAQQAAALVQVKADSIRRWLAEGKAHGVRTSGGQHRICKVSLFQTEITPYAV